eukprot:3735167-Lingulodinium_polyedra.AAC.1
MGASAAWLATAGPSVGLQSDGATTKQQTRLPLPDVGPLPRPWLRDVPRRSPTWSWATPLP